MATTSISEAKVKIVIDNYFTKECNVNTSIREAFEKGFRLGIKKASNAADAVEVVRCEDCMHWEDDFGYCNVWEQFLCNHDFFCACGKRRTDDG